MRVTLASSYGLQQTLTLAAPLILTGAAVAVTMRINIWNVGADGQFYAGALAATAVGLFVDGPPWLMLGLMGLAAAAAGAAWMVVPAVGRAYAGISEIITTLLSSFVASYLVAWLAAGPWRDPLVPTQAATARIPYELPGLNDGAHLGIVVAVVVVALLGVFLNYSKWGYELAGHRRQSGRGHVRGLSGAPAHDRGDVAVGSTRRPCRHGRARRLVIGCRAACPTSTGRWGFQSPRWRAARSPES